MNHDTKSRAVTVDSLLSGSVLWRCLVRLMNGFFDAAKRSFLVTSVHRLIENLRNWAEGSVAVRLGGRLADRVGRSIQDSGIVRRFLKEDEDGRFRERGIFYRAFLEMINLLRRLWRFLKCDERFAEARILHPWGFVVVVTFLLPLLPTMAILTLVLLSVFSLFLSLLQRETHRLAYSSVNKYVWLYALVYGLSTLTSVTPRASLNVGLITICFVLFFHVVLTAIETREHLRRVLGALALVGLLMSLFGFVQFLFPDRYATTWLDEEMFEFGARVYSTLANPNVLGTYLLLATPLVFAGFLTSKLRRGRYFYLICTLCMLLCLVLTYSRGAYVGILIAAAVFLIMLDRRFIVPGIIAAVLLLFLMPEAILQRIFSIGDLADTSTNFRVLLWLGTLNMLRDYWLSGVGPGEAAFGTVYPLYAFATIHTPHSHNLFLQIVSDAGLPGLVVFLGVLWQFFKNCFAAIRRRVTGENRILIIASISAIVGFLVQGMTDYTFYNYRVMLFFWMALAIGMVAVRFARAKQAEPAEIRETAKCGEGVNV